MTEDNSTGGELGREPAAARGIPDDGGNGAPGGPGAPVAPSAPENVVQAISGPPEAVAQVMRQAWILPAAGAEDPPQESVVLRALEQTEQHLAEFRSAASEAEAAREAASVQADVLHGMLLAAREELEAAHQAAAAAAAAAEQERGRREHAERQVEELDRALAEAGGEHGPAPAGVEGVGGDREEAGGEQGADRIAPEDPPVPGREFGDPDDGDPAAAREAPAVG